MQSRLHSEEMDLKVVSQTYQNELLLNVVPFWEKYSIDHKYGGYFTCLDREGKVFDTDKFVWLQARQVWMFSKLYLEVRKESSWLQTAIHGAEFLRNYGHDGDFNWYFSLNRAGKPLIQPYNIFSDCFAAMAFAQLALATGKDEYTTVATRTFENILERQTKPRGKYSKVYPGTRPLRDFALPMILSNLSLELEHLLEPEIVDNLVEKSINEVMGLFSHRETGMILENINMDGSFSDSFEGRLVNPGHVVEAMWFIMDLAERKKDASLMENAVSIMLQHIQFGWDETHKGIFYFMDIKGHPTQQLEWDQKLWWVHLEALTGLLKGYHLTENQACFDWFKKIHHYTWDHFPDPEFGEWFGYLNRQGEVLLPLKGGKWKGCFHVPRGLYQCWKTLEKIRDSELS